MVIAVLKVTVVLRVVAARMIVALKVIVAIRAALNDLAARAMSVVRNGIVKNHVIAPSHLATDACSSITALCP